MTTPAPELDADSRSGLSVAHADDKAGGGAEIIDAAAANDLPTSFGVFKPVGHVMLGLPTQAQLNALVTALSEAGWPKSALRQFSPQDSEAELQAMVDKAGVLAGFGYEITVLRRYVSLTQAGYRWLLVQADDLVHATAAAKLAHEGGATLGIYYRTLAIEELIH